MANEIEITLSEAYTLCSWFNAVHKFRPSYLDAGDYALAKKLREQLGIPVTKHIEENATSSGEQTSERNRHGR